MAKMLNAQNARLTKLYATCTICRISLKYTSSPGETSLLLRCQPHNAEHHRVLLQHGYTLSQRRLVIAYLQPLGEDGCTGLQMRACTGALSCDAMELSSNAYCRMMTLSFTTNVVGGND